ncbi:5-demethoxyubiquinol-8 5-hydroxylase UbiM [Sphingomonas sp. VNH70]|uniref:5-demethoxyubiquinol-8 5-hydroxylase UbiM n=1 Tax=Sphingomonas silueang TaxID=3156617 RepID=UPI0032B50E1A
MIVVGAGPAGLAFARALRGSGLRVTLVEGQSRDGLAHPMDDGREIALTHRSVATLRALGAWDGIDPASIAPLRQACVLDGRSPFALSFAPPEGGGEADGLGYLVSNHRIRRALFAAVEGQGGMTLLPDARVTTAVTGDAGARVVLHDGRTIRGRLLVAADSRFSAVRTQLGIPARIEHMGASMLVARVTHAEDHGGVATEWFGHGQTIALLPLTGRRASVVLTLPGDAAARLAVADHEALSRELTRRSAGRLGAMRVQGDARLYPLATVWSRHFAATRAALIGDAAVGMHPVTAHGFNLGLRGASSLAALIRVAARRGRDIGGSAALRRYEAEHRLAAGPLFTATGTIVRLFTDDSPLSRLARPAVLRIAAHSPVRRVATHLLMSH